MSKADAFVLAALILFSSIITFTPRSQGGSTPTISVDPSWTTVQLNETAVSVNVTITQAMNVSGWEFSLYYVKSILHSVTATVGDFLSKGGASTWFWIEELDDNYNSTHGRVSLLCIQLPPLKGVDGDGTLATVTFQPLSGGNSTLHLSDLDLVDPGGNEIRPINSSDGTVRVIGTVDIAITDVNPLKTVVGQGYSMNMTVTVGNQGDQPATFNVTVYANTTAIQTETLTLTSQSFTTITFTWNTSGFAKGNYTISAYAWPVQGETDTADNTLVDGWAYLSIPGDVNVDLKVNVLDAIILSGAFGSFPGHPRWNPNADINGDGRVNILDAIILAGHFGEVDP
jgi:hypothetical protein